MTIATRTWEDQLVSLAARPPGWFEERRGRWGLPVDEGALTTARRFLGRLGAVAERVRCDSDPQDGAVHLRWGRPNGGTLSVYVAAGVVELILAFRSRKSTAFEIDREDVPFDEAAAIVGDWLTEEG